MLELMGLECCGIKEARGLPFDDPELNSAENGDPTYRIGKKELTTLLARAKSPRGFDPGNNAGVVLFTSSERQKNAAKILRSHSEIREIGTFKNPNTGREVTIWLGLAPKVKMEWVAPPKAKRKKVTPLGKGLFLKEQRW